MYKKWNLFVKLSVILFTAILLSACDVGIYDIPGNTDGPSANLDLEIKDFLKPKTCYQQLLSDLEFMKVSCYTNEKLAATQSFTIMLSYGIADMSKDSSSFKPDQLKIKVNLYETIRTIYLYSNSSSETMPYIPELILINTESAITYCKSILSYL